MAKPRMDLRALVGKLLQEQDGDVLREGVRVLAQALMEAEVTELVALSGMSAAEPLDAGEHRLALSGPTMPAAAALSWRKPWNGFVDVAGGGHVGRQGSGKGFVMIVGR